MRIVLQRVNHASVTVEEKTIGSISHGLLLLVGFGTDDTAAVLQPMCDKICNLRIFPDERGRFDKSVLDLSGAILLVPQFTLFADTTKERRPEFFSALEPSKAKELFASFVELFRKNSSLKIETGEFGAYMKVALENDGPVTILF